MKFIELCRTFSEGGGRRWYADGKRISQAEYEELSARSQHTDCFTSNTRRNIARLFKTIRLKA